MRVVHKQAYNSKASSSTRVEERVRLLWPVQVHLKHCRAAVWVQRPQHIAEQPHQWRVSDAQCSIRQDPLQA